MYCFTVRDVYPTKGKFSEEEMLEGLTDLISDSSLEGDN